MLTTENPSAPPVAELSGKGLSMKSLQQSQLACQKATDNRIQYTEDKFPLLLERIDKLPTVTENAFTVAMTAGAQSTQLREELGKMGSEVNRLQRLIAIKRRKVKNSSSVCEASTQIQRQEPHYSCVPRVPKRTD